MHKIWILLHVFLIISFGIISFSSSETEEVKGKVSATKDPLTIEVMLETHYIDGKVEEKQLEKTIISMEDFWATYDDWQVIEQKEGIIRFKKEEDDISSYLKAHGYFGLKEGRLTIFEGTPVKDTAVQSFYQIETEELETHLLDNLKEGIKIKTKEDYLEVLEAFRSYQNIESVNS